jgi:uncharacterized protein
VATQKLHKLAERAEADFIPNDRFEELLKKENEDYWKYGGRSIYGSTSERVVV